MTVQLTELPLYRELFKIRPNLLLIGCTSKDTAFIVLRDIINSTIHHTCKIASNKYILTIGGICRKYENDYEI
jgi:hypothetical protein